MTGNVCTKNYENRSFITFEQSQRKNQYLQHFKSEYLTNNMRPNQNHCSSQLPTPRGVPQKFLGIGVLTINRTLAPSFVKDPKRFESGKIETFCTSNAACREENHEFGCNNGLMWLEATQVMEEMCSKIHLQKILLLIIASSKSSQNLREFPLLTQILRFTDYISGLRVRRCSSQSRFICRESKPRRSLVVAVMRLIRSSVWTIKLVSCRYFLARFSQYTVLNQSVEHSNSGCSTRSNHEFSEVQKPNDWR